MKKFLSVLLILFVTVVITLTITAIEPFIIPYSNIASIILLIILALSIIFIFVLSAEWLSASVGIISYMLIHLMIDNISCSESKNFIELLSNMFLALLFLALPTKLIDYSQKIHNLEKDIESIKIRLGMKHNPKCHEKICDYLSSISKKPKDKV